MSDSRPRRPQAVIVLAPGQHLEPQQQELLDLMYPVQQKYVLPSSGVLADEAYDIVGEWMTQAGKRSDRLLDVIYPSLTVVFATMAAPALVAASCYMTGCGAHNEHDTSISTRVFHQDPNGDWKLVQ
jgi:hypothetical protein